MQDRGEQTLKNSVLINHKIRTNRSDVEGAREDSSSEA